MFFIWKFIQTRIAVHLDVFFFTLGYVKHLQSTEGTYAFQTYIFCEQVFFFFKTCKNHLPRVNFLCFSFNTRKDIRDIW